MLLLLQYMAAASAVTCVMHANTTGCIYDAAASLTTAWLAPSGPSHPGSAAANLQQLSLGGDHLTPEVSEGNMQPQDELHTSSSSRGV